MITITEELNGKLVRLIDTDGQTFVGYVCIITYAQDDIDGNRDSITLEIDEEYLLCFCDNEIERIEILDPKKYTMGLAWGKNFPLHHDRSTQMLMINEKDCADASGQWYRTNPGDKIWWKDIPDDEGTWIFSFDKKKEYYFYRDVPHALTPGQLDLFVKENPFLAELRGIPLDPEDN